MRLMILGGMGYIGSELAKKALQRGDEVCLYDSLIYEQDIDRMIREIDPEKKGVKLIIGDTRNIVLLQHEIAAFKPDYVLHFAELSSVYACNHNPRLTEEVNYNASKAVMDICTIMGIKVLYNSTSSVYGTQTEEVLMDEESDLPEPTDYYTRYKIKMEEHLRGNDNVIVFRPATVFGLSPRFRIELLPNHFTYLAVARKMIKISDLNAYRAAIDLKDLVDAYFKVIDKGSWKSQVYNLGHFNMSKKEFAQGIQKILPCTIGNAPDIGDLRNLQIDSGKFNREFEFYPSTPFNESIRTIIAWLEDNKERIENSNFAELLNMPLNKWQSICN